VAGLLPETPLWQNRKQNKNKKAADLSIKHMQDHWS
jgi:hypothetical protein